MQLFHFVRTVKAKILLHDLFILVKYLYDCIRPRYTNVRQTQKCVSDQNHDAQMLMLTVPNTSSLATYSIGSPEPSTEVCKPFVFHLLMTKLKTLRERKDLSSSHPVVHVTPGCYVQLWKEKACLSEAHLWLKYLSPIYPFVLAPQF